MKQYAPEANVSRTMPECPIWDMEQLVGKVLSLLEYGIEDQQRLEAGKAIFKQTMWDWYNQLPDGGFTSVDREPAAKSE